MTDIKFGDITGEPATGAILSGDYITTNYACILYDEDFADTGKAKIVIQLEGVTVEHEHNISTLYILEPYNVGMLVAGFTDALKNIKSDEARQAYLIGYLEAKGRLDNGNEETSEVEDNETK